VLLYDFPNTVPDERYVCSISGNILLVATLEVLMSRPPEHAPCLDQCDEEFLNPKDFWSSGLIYRYFNIGLFNTNLVDDSYSVNTALELMADLTTITKYTF
jgi:hypothetical protein